MVAWAKDEIELQDGTKVAAQMPVIVSASRSTDIPAFYADWFMERLKDKSPHLCHYCYANTNNAAAMENWKRHCECKSAETIKGELFTQDGHYIGRQSVSKGGRFL